MSNLFVPLPELQHRVLIGPPAWADLGDCELPQDYRLQKELDSHCLTQKQFSWHKAIRKNKTNKQGGQYLAAKPNQYFSRPSAEVLVARCIAAYPHSSKFPNYSEQNQPSRLSQVHFSILKELQPCPDYCAPS
jgi:hypothetical protein